MLVSAAAETAGAAVSTPFSQTGLSLPNTSTVVTYQVDLSTLPERPSLIVEATPASNHPDMTIELEITGCTVFNGGGSCPSSILSPATPGPQSVRYRVYACDLDVVHPAYVGETCDIKVRAANFGSGTGPAKVDLAIRGQTDIPSSTLLTEVSSTIQTVSIPPSKDSTIYQTGQTSNNGRGIHLWAYHFAGSDRRNALLAFDVPSAVPAGSTIVDARLELSVLGLIESATVELSAIPRDPLSEWLEGTSRGIRDELEPPLPATNDAATWTHRRWMSIFPVAPWQLPGGDRGRLPLLDATVVSDGPLVLSSPELLAHVQALHRGSAGFDGLLLSTVFGGLQLASRDHPNGDLRPRLVVQHTPPPTPRTLVTGTLSYFSEGQNFRWIYDLDDDGLWTTPIQGQCAITGGGVTAYPISYQFQGSTSYAGLDCCTWQIGSRTGVTGTGQAIFFVNVSATDPAHQPTDYDTDGIKDLCDNCVTVPNGPLLGSCTVGALSLIHI